MICFGPTPVFLPVPAQHTGIMEQKRIPKQSIRIEPRGEPFIALVKLYLLTSLIVTMHSRDAIPDAEEDEEHRQYLWSVFPSITDDKAILKVSRFNRPNQISLEYCSGSVKTDHLPAYAPLSLLSL